MLTGCNSEGNYFSRCRLTTDICKTGRISVKGEWKDKKIRKAMTWLMNCAAHGGSMLTQISSFSRRFLSLDDALFFSSSYSLWFWLLFSWNNKYVVTSTRNFWYTVAYILHWIIYKPTFYFYSTFSCNYLYYFLLLNLKNILVIHILFWLVLTRYSEFEWDLIIIFTSTILTTCWFVCDPSHTGHRGHINWILSLLDRFLEESKIWKSSILKDWNSQP